MKKGGFHQADGKVLCECRALIDAAATLHLATVDSKGHAEASYAPFVAADGFCFYLFLSDLARHTANIRASGRASVLLIEPEESASNAFARRRGVFDCRVKLIPRTDSEWQERLRTFEGKFGAIIDTLRSLQDFNLFRLEPVGGSYVKGFGQAYRFSEVQLRTADSL